MSDLF